MNTTQRSIRAGELLRTHRATITTAESCTGGMIAAALTDIAGSSAYVRGGIVAYDNTIKQTLLGVTQATLVAHGAVSEGVAGEMAQGARTALQADFALSVTGIAGPGGGTDEKPVGLTYIGLAGPDDLLVVRRFVWEGDRAFNRRASVDAALDLLIVHFTTTPPSNT